MKKAFLLLIFSFNVNYSQISGCTDPLSKNFNPKATKSDGSCCYKKIKIKSDFSVQLSDSLIETSSLFFYNSLLWTANDDNDATLYGINTKGIIEKKIIINTLKNKEWEEITQDSSYIYLGDFGNNHKGNRTDLRILRILKSELYSNKPQIDTIAFSYSNQTDYSIQKPNKTNFDCEAFIISGDTIYLFTKQFKNKKTTVYSIPKFPGKHLAHLEKSYNVKGLITGATYIEDKKIIALSGYTKLLKPFIYLLYDFKENDFFSGNKRKIILKLPFHQVEGITTIDGLHYFITNEKTTKKPFISISQQLHQLDLSRFLGGYLKK